MLDGASNDEGWGRQTMLATVPVGAVQEVAVLSNAFSAEFGWTAGPALNIVTKSGTNDAARRRALPGASRRHAGEDVLDRRLLRAVGLDAASTPTTLDGDQPGGHSGRAEPGLRLDRRADRQGQDVLLRDGRLHACRIGRRSSRPRCRRSCCRRTAASTYVGHYRQTLVNARLDHKLTPTQTLMVRVNFDHFYDTNPERRRRRHERAERRAQVHAAVAGRRRSITRRCSSSNLLNEARFAYLQRRSGHALGSRRTLSTTYTRAGSVPFTIGQSRVVRPLRPPGAVLRHAVVVARPAQRCASAAASIHHTSGGTGSEPGHGRARHVHVPQHDDGAVRSADAGRRAAVHAADQLRHHQLRAEAVAVGGVRAGQHPREQRPHARRSGCATTGRR